MRNEIENVSLRNYELEEGTRENLKLNAEYIIENSVINLKKLYHKDSIRARYSWETKADYKYYYVDTISSYIKNKVIFKLNKI